MKGAPGLTATKPISAWNKPLKADFKGLFKALSKAAAHGAAGKWDELASDAVDALTAVGLETDPGQLLWLLIRRASTRALFELVEQSSDLFVGSPPKNMDGFLDGLDLSLEQSELTLGPGFFDNPRDFPLIAQLQAPLCQWAQGYGLSGAQANALAGRFPGYFPSALVEEWRKTPEQYESIKRAFHTPFTKAAKLEQAWMHNNASLKRQVDEGVFQEPFGLRQVFVPLAAYYEKKQEQDGRLDDKTEGVPTDRSEVIRVVVDLRAELESWRQRHDQHDAIRVISGGPGCGKSSFARMYAAELADAPGLRVLYIPLHLFDPTGDLATSVGRFVRESDILPDHPMDFEEGDPALFLIFDGLDELARQGNVGTEIARDFLRDLDKSVGLRNLNVCRLQVLVSGRELTIQETQSELRKARQVLTILPYFVPKNDRKKFLDSDSLLKEDRRDRWWKQYAALTGRAYEGLPKELARSDLDEITSQPLLNYLVALSYTRGELDFKQDVNLNQVYRDLVEGVYERGYEPRGTYVSIRNMERADFIRVLEEIALAAWHGDGRTTTIREIQEHCKSSGLGKLLDVFQEGAAAGVTRLLAAFFFRQHGRRQTGDRTFEFTHKSFGEYLAARRIVRAVQRMSTQLARRENDPDEGWDERDALKHWTLVCGPAPVTTYLREFTRQEVALRDKKDVSRWQASLGKLIQFFLQHGLPMEQLPTRLTYVVMTRQARNAEEAVLVVLAACANLTEAASLIHWPGREAAGAWLRRLQGQRVGNENSLTLQSLSYLDLSGCALYFSDFYAAEMSGCDLASAVLADSMLNRADLGGANLREADLIRAQLCEANLRQANLTRAILVGANLRQTNLREANLVRANLSEADLREANLRGTDLREANLQGTDLRGANLRDADLRGAFFEGANLKGANLEGAQYTAAQLEKAKTSGAGQKKHSPTKH